MLYAKTSLAAVAAAAVPVAADAAPHVRTRSLSMHVRECKKGVRVVDSRANLAVGQLKMRQLEK